MALTPYEDTEIRNLATYLKERLNTDAGETVVNGMAVTNLYHFRDLPLLAVFRTSSTGALLQQSTLNIIYYTFPVKETSSLDGVTNWVAKKIAYYLQEYRQHSECPEIIGDLRCDFRILRNNDGTLLPNVRIFVDIEDGHLV